MKESDQLPPSGVWFASRVDYRHANRLAMRMMAVAANGLFIVIAAGLGYLGLDKYVGIPVGILVMVTGLAALGMNPRKHARERQLRRFASRDGVFVRLTLVRDEVELGTDDGWLMREEGVLRFEGARTRFEIVEDDLSTPFTLPNSQASKATLRIAAPGGVVEASFTRDRPSDPDLMALFKSWSPAPRQLLGPPLLATRRPLLWYIHRSGILNALHVCVLICLPIRVMALTDVVSQTVLTYAVLASAAIAPVAVAITLLVATRKDKAGRARLAALDAANVVVENSAEGTGNPMVNAAVG